MTSALALHTVISRFTQLNSTKDVLIEACGPTAQETRWGSSAFTLGRLRLEVALVSCEFPRFAPVLAGDFCQERVELHRPSYLEQKGLDGQHTEHLMLGGRNIFNKHLRENAMMVDDVHTHMYIYIYIHTVCI